MLKSSSQLIDKTTGQIIGRYFVLVFLTLFIGGKLSAQKKQADRIDSLRQVAASATTLDGKLSAMYEIGNACYKSDPDSALHIGNLILEKAPKATLPAKHEGNGYFLLGLAHNSKGDNLAASDFFAKCIAIREKDPAMTEALANAYHSGMYPLFNTSQYSKAMAYEVKALQLFTEIKDSNRIASCYNELGRLSSALDEPRRGLEYLKKGLEISLLIQKSPYYSYSRLGEAYLKLGNLDSSLLVRELALKTAMADENPRAVAIEKNNIAEMSVKKGDFATAKRLYEESLAFFEGKNEKNNAPLILCNLTDVALTMNDPKAALGYCQRALKIATEVNNPATLSLIFELQSKTYEALGDAPNALAAVRKHLVWKDSVTALERIAEAAAVEAQFRTAENEKTITDQNLQLERQKGRNRLLMAFTVFALITGAGIALFLREKRRRAELNLQLQAAEASRLRELDHVKSAFFANISHEFRTPLTLILGPLREMEEGSFQGDAHKYYGIMRRNASRLLQLVNQLLDLSRLESGKLSLNLQPSDIAHHLRAVAGSFQSLADQRQIDFQVDVPAQPVWVKFDADKLEKIVGNLLSNAFKFTPEEGSVDLRFRTYDLRLPDERGHPILHRISEIVIQDTGIGIPPDQLPHIFERFYQVENTGSDLQPGSGIGLALTKELVELHGGKIEVKSRTTPLGESKAGTTFMLTFRFDEAAPGPSIAQTQITNYHSPQSEIVNPEADVVNQKNTSRLPLILIAEDHPDVRTYVAERLSGQYQLLEASNGQTALEMALAKTPDLILTDLMMPELDGLELTRRLKTDVRTNHIPIVMLTAKGDRTDRIGGIETGAEAYLTKPFDAEELRATLANLLAQRRILQEKFAKQINLETPKDAVVSVEDKFLQQVLNTIEENLDDETFGVEQLASAVAMSRSNLFRKVEALLGKSPVQLIRERRLLKAKHLLENGAGNSTEVAYMTGFQSLSYFAKCYQEMFGELPGQVAKRRGGG